MREVNFVLIPEAPFVMEGEGGLMPALEARLDLRSHAVIVLAEGAGQHLLQATGRRDASGNPVLGDITTLLRDSINDYFKARGKPVSMKFIDPSYIIRSVPANANDRVYCGFLGQYAVHRAAMAGKTDMVATRSWTGTSICLSVWSPPPAAVSTPAPLLAGRARVYRPSGPQGHVPRRSVRTPPAGTRAGAPPLPPTPQPEEGGDPLHPHLG